MKKVLVLFAITLFATVAFAQNATFESFLQQFPKVSLPYTLGEQDLRSHLESRATNAPVAKAKRLAWEYYEFIPTLETDASENRMPVYPEPIAMFETADNYAVIFNTGRTFARQYKTYNIAVFTKEGKFVASRCIAGVNPTALASATIDENLNVTIKEYSINWSKDYNTNGFDGNSILGLTQVATRTVKATASVVEEGENWNYRFQPAEAKTTTSALTSQAK
jgi:hypothetical protein